ncbi:DNA-binding response regulator [Halopseudomonas laoshanensis]|uniref:DNA-binding response regulator n=2 Tax=Halopseudomonas laoshanensis TaxID=2268758 RepID=A0A7V7KX23_9GAMM|nr:DNA-binding response regulator [Halopseudomonas laoshanensis]
MAGKPITLMIIDDQPLLRAGVAAIISSNADIALVGETESERDAMELLRDLQPDVILMPVQRPIMNSIDAINRMLSEHPQAKIAILSTHPKELQMLQAANARACAYLLKNALHTDLVDTVLALAAGQHLLPADVKVDSIAQVRSGPLSSREWQVLRWVAKGRSNRQVAQLLTISEGTAKGHLHNAMRKLGARNRTQAVSIAMQRGVIGVEH